MEEEKGGIVTFKAGETCSPPEAKHSSYGTMWVKDVSAGSLRACVPRELLPICCYRPRMCPSYSEGADFSR